MTVAVVRSDQIVHDSTNKKNKMASSFGLIVGVVDVAMNQNAVTNSLKNDTVQKDSNGIQFENQLDSKRVSNITVIQEIAKQTMTLIKDNISILEDEIPQLKLSNANELKVLQNKIEELEELQKSLDAIQEAWKSFINIQTENRSDGQMISDIENNISVLNEEIGPLRLILLKLQSSPAQTKDLEAEQKELISKLEKEINQKKSQLEELQENRGVIAEPVAPSEAIAIKELTQKEIEQTNRNDTDTVQKEQDSDDQESDGNQSETQSDSDLNLDLDSDSDSEKINPGFIVVNSEKLETEFIAIQSLATSLLKFDPETDSEILTPEIIASLGPEWRSRIAAAIPRLMDHGCTQEEVDILKNEFSRKLISRKALPAPGR